MVQSSSTTSDGAVKWRNRTFRRFGLGELWTTPPGPRWSRVVQPGPVWSSRSSRAELPQRADAAARSERQAAGLNRNELNGPQRHAAPIAAGPQGRRGASPGWRAVDQAGPPLTGPTWSNVVQGGPGSAVWEGPSPSSRSSAQSTRNAIPRRLAEYGPGGMHAARTQLGGPPPGSLKCEYLPIFVPYLQIDDQ